MNIINAKSVVSNEILFTLISDLEISTRKDGSLEISVAHARQCQR